MAIGVPNFSAALRALAIVPSWYCCKLGQGLLCRTCTYVMRAVGEVEANNTEAVLHQLEKGLLRAADGSWEMKMS